jgi:hypothetical protein
MAKGRSNDVQDLFKEEFKRYKKSSASDFIDFRIPERFSDEVGQITDKIYGQNVKQQRKL